MKYKPLLMLCINATLIQYGQVAQAADKALAEYCHQVPYQTLSDGLERGDYEALVQRIRCREFHDGGNSEDLSVLSGMFLDRNPFLYGYILEKEGVLEENSLRSFFEMLSWDLVDDYEGREKEIRKRLELVKKIENPKIRAIATQILKSSLEDIQNLPK